MPTATVLPTSDPTVGWGALADGRLSVDVALTPVGDLSLAAGVQRLVQDVTRYLLCPVGSDPFDPTYGNPVLAMLGRPSSPNDQALFSTMLVQAQADLLSRQAQEAAMGLRTLEEQIDHFENNTVTLQSDTAGAVSLGSVLISFTIVSKAGPRSTAVVPFTLTQTL